MAKGGKRQGAGRPKGSRDKGKAAIAALEALSGKTPIELWTSILVNPESPLELRLQVAKELAPYIHPKLSSVESNINATIAHENTLDRVASLEAQGTI